MDDMLVEPSSLTADETMDMEMERFVIFTIDNGEAQSADGASIWFLSTRQHSLEEDPEDEAAEFFDQASDDDGHDDDDGLAAYRFDQDLENEAAEFSDGASDDDDGQDDDDDVAAYRFDPEFVHPTEETVQAVNLPQQLEVDLFQTVVVALVHYFDFVEGPYGDDGAVVPASDAAVAGLEKQAFHPTAEGCGITGCAICLEEFDDGEEVTVMPCSRGHEFHSECITEWLGKNNTCPLCRHALPTDVDDGP